MPGHCRLGQPLAMVLSSFASRNKRLRRKLSVWHETTEKTETDVYQVSIRRRIGNVPSPVLPKHEKSLAGQARLSLVLQFPPNCQMSLGPSLPLAPCYHPRAGINKGQTSLPGGAHNKGSAWSCTASPHGPVWTRSFASRRWPKRMDAGETPEYQNR